MAMLSPVAGVAALARRPTPGGKGPEARDRDLLAARQRLGNGGEYRGDGAVRRGPGDGGPRGNAGRQLGLVHGFSRRGAIVHRCRTRLRIRVPRRRTARNGRPTRSAAKAGSCPAVRGYADMGSRNVVSGGSRRAECRSPGRGDRTVARTHRRSATARRGAERSRLSPPQPRCPSAISRTIASSPRNGARSSAERLATNPER